MKKFDDVLERSTFFSIWLLALLTCLYHLALILGLSYSSLITFLWYPGTFLACCLAGYSLLRNRGPGAESSGTTGNLEYFILAGLCVMASALAFFSVRPNDDDVNYLALAVFASEHAESGLLWRYPFFAFPDSGHFSLDIFQAYPYVVAAIANAVGRQALEGYHFIMPVVGASGFVVAWYLLIYRLTEDKIAALAGVAALLILVSTDGFTHRSIASFGLYRIWQGKVLLLQVLTPLAVLTIVDAMRSGGRRYWLRLVAISIAGISLSSTAQFYLPVLATLVGCSYAIAYKQLNLITKSLLAAIVMGAYSLPFTIASLLSTPRNDAYITDYGSSLHSVMETVYNWPYSMAIMLFLIGLFTFVLLKEYRVFVWLLAWSALLVVPLSFDPLAELVVKYVTSANTLWRLAYTSPVLLGAGLGVAYGYRARKLRPWAISGLVGFFLTAIVLAIFPLGVSPLSRDYVRFPAIDYKFSEESRRAALLMKNTLDPGSMLAAAPMAKTLPLLTSKFNMAAFRELDAPSLLSAEASPEEGAELLAAFRFASGLDVEESYDGFVSYIDKSPDYLVLVRSVEAQTSVASMLRGHGYAQQESNWGDYIVFKKVTP